MAVDNKQVTTTVAAGEDLSGSQYKAVALDDGKVANTPLEASGILLNKPESGAHATLAYFGELKFAAGGAIAKGDKISVTTSGWFTESASGDYFVGEAKAAVSSGANGTGFFNFITPGYQVTSLN